MEKFYQLFNRQCFSTKRVRFICCIFGKFIASADKYSTKDSLIIRRYLKLGSPPPHLKPGGAIKSIAPAVESGYAACTTRVPQQFASCACDVFT